VAVAALAAAATAHAAATLMKRPGLRGLPDIEPPGKL
jgi:hypothetical protein